MPEKNQIAGSFICSTNIEPEGALKKTGKKNHIHLSTRRFRFFYHGFPMASLLFGAKKTRKNVVLTVFLCFFNSLHFIFIPTSRLPYSGRKAIR